MSALWFVILAGMLTTYAVLDGYDLGVGALLPLICRNERERNEARDSIGPVWNGNEVWLIAAGGAMFMAFPRLYAASFSGFYLALMLVLWLLILRGVGFEFRHEIKSSMWTGFWDTTFSIASALLAVLLGVAVGNVLHGVPLDSSGTFQGSFAVILNAPSIAGGVLSLVILCMHGCAYLAWKTEGSLQARARAWIVPLGTVALVLAAVFAGVSFLMRPNYAENFVALPILFVLPIAAIGSLLSLVLTARRGNDVRIFQLSCAFIVTILGSVASGLFPRLLPALWGQQQNDLTIYNSASSSHSLVTALIMNAIGMSAVVMYTTYVHKVWGGKVRSHEPAPINSSV